jgi:cell division protein FtsQ
VSKSGSSTRRGSPGGLLGPRGGGYRATDVVEPPTPVVRQRVERDPRQRARRRARAARLAYALMLIAVTGAGVHVAWRWAHVAAYFKVAAVEVEGTSRVTPDRIVQAAGVRPGTPLWQVDTTDVAARVEALPEIRRARVVRELPNRLRVVVEERRPFTLVHAGRLHWLDDEGRPLGEARQAVSPPVPVISGLSDDELSTMRTAPGPRAQAAITLLRTLLRSGGSLASQISEIDMSRRDGPVLYTIEGVEVHLGSDDWDARLARLEGVLARVAKEDVSAVDLRFRDQVVLRRGE